MGRYGVRLVLAAALALSVAATALASPTGHSVAGAAQEWLSKCFLPLPPLSSENEVYQDANARQYADQIEQITNQQRASRKLGALKRDPHLDAVAQAHAEDMARRGYFEHESPDGMDVFDRIECVHCPAWWTGGENIAAGYRTPQIACDAWIKSKGHRFNVLNKDYDYIGVGAYYAPGTEYGWYWVQVFASWRDHADSSANDWIEPGECAPLADTQAPSVNP